MIAKQVKGKSFRGVLKYLMSKEGHSLVDKNMFGENIDGLVKEFKISQNLKPNVNKCVYHVSLSLPKNEHLSDRQWSQVGTRYLKEMGFEKSQFVMIRHTDTPFDHVHIVASRIDLEGKVVSDSYDYKRSEKAVRGIEKDFGLTTVKSSEKTLKKAPKAQELRKAIEKKEPSARMKLQSIIDFQLTRSFSTSEFVNKLELLGVGVRANIANTGLVSGISFSYDGVAFKGSDLGRGYTWNALQKRGLDYEYDRDFKRLLEARDRSKAQGKSGANRALAQSRHEEGGNFNRAAQAARNFLRQFDTGDSKSNSRASGGNRRNQGGQPLPKRAAGMYKERTQFSIFQNLFGNVDSSDLFDTSDFEDLVRMGLRVSKKREDKKALQKCLDPFDIRISQQKEREKMERKQKQKEKLLKLKKGRGRGLEIDF